MKFFIVSLIAALAAVTTASPVPAGGQSSNNNASTAHITFTGAGDGEFTQDFKTDGSSQKITNPLSVSKISGQEGVECAFLGVDGQATIVQGAGTANVRTPQVQVTGTCRAT